MTLLTALLWHCLGRLLESRGLQDSAETCYRNAASGAPHGAVESRVRLARALIDRKRFADARPIVEQALDLRPNRADAWNLLGLVRHEARELDAAAAAFERALELDPDFMLARNNRGRTHLASGEAKAALACFDVVLATDPRHLRALNNRVVALIELGRGAGAEAAVGKALELYPDEAPLHLNLGNALLQQGKGFAAAQAYRKAIELQPDFDEAHFNLSLIYNSPEHLGRAITFLERELAVRGESLDLLNRLAIAYMINSSFAKSEQICRKMIDQTPEFAPAYITLSNVLVRMGDWRGALDSDRKALEVNPDECRIHSNVMFEMNYSPEIEAGAVFEEHRAWSRRHEKPLAERRKTLSPLPGGERRLKIGYVSPDFHAHPVGYLTQGIIRQHDRDRFEIHCYARVANPDDITEDIRHNVDRWHDTEALSDADLADQVVADGIDILVDLSGHTGGNRLLLFALKPAPIQATWLGYFHSTGLEAIDYFITDPYTSPKAGGQYFSEVPVWLPNTRFCYTPPDYAPDVAPPPVLRNGFITFGTFNKLAKMNDEVVAAWAQILKRLPEARLWLKSTGLNEEAVCAQVHSRFSALGIAPERIVMRAASDHITMFEEYGEIDIALDTFPYTGGLTTFEALWMGVPVVTLAGKAVVARQSASALCNLGLADLVFDTVEEYVAGAVKLAQDSARLSELRQALRPTMRQSPLCEVAGFTRDLEHLYRRMWRAWCEGRSLPSDLDKPLDGTLEVRLP